MQVRHVEAIACARVNTVPQSGSFSSMLQPANAKQQADIASAAV
jgi:hypothetical protein